MEEEGESGSQRSGGKGKQPLTANSSRATVEDEGEEEEDEDEDHVDDYPDDEYFNIKPRDSAAETSMKLALKRSVSFHWNYSGRCVAELELMLILLAPTIATSYKSPHLNIALALHGSMS